MSLLWPLLVVGSAGAALLVVYALGPRLFRGTRPATRSLTCPSRRERVAVRFRAAVWDGRLVDVERCSAFAPPTAIACDKRCLGGAKPLSAG